MEKFKKIFDTFQRYLKKTFPAGLFLNVLELLFILTFNTSLRRLSWDCKNATRLILVGYFMQIPKALSKIRKTIFQVVKIEVECIISLVFINNS